jgi:hypothetical protein
VEEIRSNLLLLQKKNEVKKEDKRTKFKLDSLKPFRIEAFEELADYKKNPNKITEQLKIDNRKKIVISLITIVIMLMFLISILYIQLLFISISYQKNKFLIISNWLFPTLASLFILSFLISFAMNLVRTFFLFNIKEPENIILKYSKDFIETEEIKYIYSISNFLTKYKKDLNFNDKKYQ